MITPPHDRRRQPRRNPAADEPMAQIRMRTGALLTIVDVSGLGALVESTVRLVPGARVDAHVMTRDGRVLVRSRVVRAIVSALRPDAVSYRVALVFDEPVDTSASGYPLPTTTVERASDPGSSYP